MTLSAEATGAAPKVEKVGGAKTLTIGSTATGSSTAEKAAAAKQESTGKSAAEAGAKVKAAKAIEKTESKASGKSGSVPPSGSSSPTVKAEDKKEGKEADAVAKEQAADIDEEILNEVYGKVGLASKTDLGGP